MARITKEESAALLEHIEHLKRTAAERGIALNSPADYCKLSFTIRQENGTIPAHITYTQATERRDPGYVPELKRLYDHLNSRRKKQPKPRGVARYVPFHVRLGDKETTVSLHPTMSILMALHLGMQPNTPQARAAVRKWLQERIDRYDDPGRSAVSHWLQGKILESLVSDELRGKYGEWIENR